MASLHHGVVTSRKTVAESMSDRNPRAVISLEALIESSADFEKPSFKTDVQGFPAPEIHVASPTTDQPSAVAKLVTGTWMLELVSLWLSIALFGIFWALLASSDGKPVSRWEFVVFGISTSMPSTATAIMTAFRVFMSSFVAAAMGQLKWHHFRQPIPRPVASRQAFDAATRGAPGSIKLLMSKAILNSVHVPLGCILLLGTLGLQMITSGAIDQTSDLHWEDSSVNATFPYNRFFNATIQNITTTTRTEEKNVIAYREIRSSLYFGWSFAESSYNITTARIPLFCSETKCQWQKITTLDIDYQCRSAPTVTDDDGFGHSNQANITSRVGVTGPNGVSDFTSAQIRLKSSHTVPSESSFNSSFSENPGLILHLAGIAEVGEKQFEAAECVFYWRVRRMTNVVYHAINQSLEQNEVYENDRAKIGLINNKRSLVFEDHCNYNTTEAQASTDVSGINNCTYGIILDAHAGVRELLLKFLPGQVIREELNGETVYRPNTTAIDLFQWTWRRVQDDSQPAPLNKTMQIYSNNVSKMISYNIRCLSNNTVAGQVGLYDQFFQVNTLYVLYPGLMLLLSAYLLAYTIWRSWNEPTWKSSLLPFLYHEFETPALDHGHGSTNLAWMKKAGDQKKVILRDDDDGMGLKLRVT